MALGFVPYGHSGTHSYSERLRLSLARAYALCRRRQVAAALRNAQARDLSQRRTAADFKVGDLALLWEPSYWSRQTGRPRKLSYRWTGPHSVTMLLEHRPNLVRVWHARRGLTLTVNVNRLIRFHPWEEDKPSVSFSRPTGAASVDLADFADRIVVGALCIVRLQVDEDNSMPWAVGKLLRVENEQVLVQWFGNAFQDVLRKQQPGWRDPRDRRVYYRRGRIHGSHEPYVNLHDNLRLTCSHLYTAGFDLTNTGHVPRVVLRFLSAHPDIDWRLPD